MSYFVTLYEAKTHLSGLVDRAAAGEEIIIAKNGIPQARLMPLAVRGEPRRPANAMRISRIAADFDTPDPAIEALFGGQDASTYCSTPKSSFGGTAGQGAERRYARPHR